jgi:hypothetical protein
MIPTRKLLRATSERALRAEPVPVAAASLRRTRPQDSPVLVSLALWLSPRQPQRGAPKTAQGWSDVSAANVAQPWVGERRNVAVERLVWHRDQVDRRPQFNEFLGGQMRPRPRAAKRPSVCSAWVSGQFHPAHRRFAPRTGLTSGRPLEGYSGHLTVTTRKHEPVRSSHVERSQCDARTPNSKLDRALVPTGA